jgi:hypothetical protein
MAFDTIEDIPAYRPRSTVVSIVDGPPDRPAQYARYLARSATIPGTFGYNLEGNRGNAFTLDAIQLQLLWQTEKDAALLFFFCKANHSSGARYSGRLHLRFSFFEDANEKKELGMVPVTFAMDCHGADISPQSEYYPFTRDLAVRSKFVLLRDDLIMASWCR